MLVNAYSEDGFIERQFTVTDLKFGKYPSSRNGCGWIAFFNICWLLNRDCTPAEAAKRLSPFLLFGGRFGTPLVALAFQLHRGGIKYTMRFTEKSVLKAAVPGCCGILLLRAKKYGHYTAFDYIKQGARIFNGSISTENKRMPLCDYVKGKKPWLCAAIIIDKRKNTVEKQAQNDAEAGPCGDAPRP